MVRVIPTSLMEKLSRRYHPYFAKPSVNIIEMSQEDNFEERIEAFDTFNHLVSTYIGDLRQYHAKREAIKTLCTEMKTLEKHMLELHDRMYEQHETIKASTSVIPLAFELTSGPALAEASSSEEEEEDSIIEEDTSTTSVGDTIQPASERIHIGEEDLLITCVTVLHDVDEADPRNSFAIRKRIYGRPVPCEICEESFYNQYKCANIQCKGRVCYSCFSKIKLRGEPSCPFCRSLYRIARDYIPMH